MEATLQLQKPFGKQVTFSQLSFKNKGKIILAKTLGSILDFAKYSYLASRPLKRPRGHIISDIWWKKG